MAEARVTLAAAGRAEHQQVGTLIQPAIAGGDSHDLRLRYHRQRLELECLESFSGQEAGFGEMAFDTAAIAFGQFVLGERGQEPGGGPALLVGLLGELRPHHLGGGQTQFVEQQCEPSGVDDGGLHAASPAPSRPSS